jgi:sugar phosphate isomerase/epimerase
VRRLEERSLVERFPCLLEAAEALGARHIKVTPDGDDRPWDRGHWAEKFAELASQARDVGARLGIEFFPWSNFKTLHDGLQLVEDATPTSRWWGRCSRTRFIVAATAARAPSTCRP